MMPSVEAQKFLLTNRNPEEWKNRIEQNNTGSLDILSRLRVVRENRDGDTYVPRSEDEIPD